MKTWNAPAIEALNIKGTQYHQDGGTIVDGQYVSVDGKFNHYTYGPSSGNSGIPETNVKPEEI